MSDLFFFPLLQRAVLVSGVLTIDEISVSRNRKGPLDQGLLEYTAWGAC